MRIVHGVSKSLVGADFKKQISSVEIGLITYDNLSIEESGRLAAGVLFINAMGHLHGRFKETSR